VLPGDLLALPVAYCHSKDELYVDRALVVSLPPPPGAPREGGSSMVCCCPCADALL
jgi:hypothetical protein